MSHIFIAPISSSHKERLSRAGQDAKQNNKKKKKRGGFGAAHPA
jgi:hypothetical protein